MNIDQITAAIGRAPRGPRVGAFFDLDGTQAEPITRILGNRHIICTELKARDGVLTGRTSFGVQSGESKAAGVRAFAREHRTTLRNSFGYANGGEDVPFLAAVGRPYPLNRYPMMRRAAFAHGWPTLTLREPGVRWRPDPDAPTATGT
jgi:putative phosphoserine phosphatase/1-acylglycerol-3-phosphate O-acyltransferase